MIGRAPSLDELESGARGVLAAVAASVLRRADTSSPHCILFVGADPGVGTTSLATCTAIGLARQLRRDVALVETNLHAPGMAALLDLPAEPGLRDVLDGRVTRAQATRAGAVPGLHVLVAGAPREVPGELAGTGVHALLRETLAAHACVVLDAPPLVEHPDAQTLLAFADDVVVVLGAGATRQERALATLRIAKDAGANVLGTVLNRFRADRPFAHR